MTIIPVPVVGSARRPYGKGPQRSGGHDDVGRFFMGVPGAAAAASQVRPLELLSAILAPPRRTSWYTHEKLPNTVVTAWLLRSFSIWMSRRSDHRNRYYCHFVVGWQFCWGCRCERCRLGDTQFLPVRVYFWPLGVVPTCSFGRNLPTSRHVGDMSPTCRRHTLLRK